MASRLLTLHGAVMGGQTTTAEVQHVYLGRLQLTQCPLMGLLQITHY